MKKYIIATLFSGLSLWSFAQYENVVVETNASDSLQQFNCHLSVPEEIKESCAFGVDSDVFENSPHIDIAKALYGKIAGLNVYQGTGPSASNISSMSIHGHAPLVLVDGFPRDIKDITASEIESFTVLKDAVASALYGVRGANGVILITTKRGHNSGLKMTAKYQFGLNTQFRKPEFADAFTYATNLNTALRNDGLEPVYKTNALSALMNNTYPNAFPNVNWWDEVYNTFGYNHRLGLTFQGGSDRFRYYSVVDYMHDTGFFKSSSGDSRYNINPTDVRLNIRSNIDVNITNSTSFKLGLVGKLDEDNRANYGSIYSILYNTPSAAFPIRYPDGIYGGTNIYGENNPVALLYSTGNTRYTTGTLLVDAKLKQDLEIIAKGLSAEVLVAFDNSGRMYDATSKTYRYEDARPSFVEGTLVTNPVVYGTDSEVLSHSQEFSSLYMRNALQGKVNYEYKSEKNEFNSTLMYDQQDYIRSGRNNSTKRQSYLAIASYTYNRRYSVSGVVNYSGSAYLEEGSRFDLYPAFSAAWNISEEEFMTGNASRINNLKLYGSYGFAGWDGNLTHELYLQSYGGSGITYYFTNNVNAFYGRSEGSLPVLNLKAEKSEKATLGIDMAVFENSLLLNVESFYEKRSNILVPASTVSGVIGIDAGSENAGIQEYRGFDVSFTWNKQSGDFAYSLYANMSYLDSKIINENQEFQQYDYLYHAGNRAGQSYGLEMIGFFHDEMEINNSPIQTFSDVHPGDIKYKDQNGDNVIDEQDVVKMFGSRIPRCYFGFGFNSSYKNFEISAEFQGITGVTVNLLNSPLYKPLLNNGNISQTFLDEEVPWTLENASNTTMPRLTTLPNANNYRNNSLWYRDGSFIKLRSLKFAYMLPKETTKLADLKIYLQGTNLFSLDNLSSSDPEQLQANYPAVRTYWVGCKFNF